MAPAATIRPRAMMTTSSQTSSTRSSWWLEKTTPTPAAARSRTTSVMVAMPMGSRPLNGSSRTSSSGSCDERRGELDPLLVAVRELLELGLRRGRQGPSAPASGSRRRWRPCRSCRAAGRSRRAARRPASADTGHAARACSRSAAARRDPRPGPASGPRRDPVGPARRCIASSSSCPRRWDPGSPTIRPGRGLERGPVEGRRPARSASRGR